MHAGLGIPFGFNPGSFVFPWLYILLQDDSKFRLDSMKHKKSGYPSL